MLNNTLNKVRDRVFSNIHSNNLIYNTCWEDPRCDRQMLQLNEESKVVMITSAGCNALDYLLDNPSEINTIDMNPRQNALLDLKLTTFRVSDFKNLYQLFGEGHHPGIKKLYEEVLRPALPLYAQEIWDKKLYYFVQKGLKKSLYFHGTSGNFAWLFFKYTQTIPKMRQMLLNLLDAKNMEEQRKIYFEVEPKLINLTIRWLINRHLTLSMLGVPRAQRQLIIDEYPNGVAGFVKDCLRQVFTELPVADNYFWRLYITGKYTPDCCPNYLMEENFEFIKAHSHQIKPTTNTISGFLKENPQAYSHYILLDHQDWLAAHDVPALNEEWELILKNSRKGTKILIRSAALRIDFFPDFVLEAIDFDTTQTKVLHKQDRVGTYGSVYFGTVK